MKIHSIGYHHPHDRDFVIDRPNGIGQSWLFLIFQSRAVVRLNGREINVDPNTCLMYSGDAPEYYRACEAPYVDDWFHFTIETRDLQLFEELAIPINQVIPLTDTSELSALIRIMTYEFYSTNLYSADLVGLYLRTLFIKLSRLLNTAARELSENGCGKYDGMLYLRNLIYNEVQSIGTVDELAQSLSMSKSSFQHTYKKVFGVNVMNDIIQSRIARSKQLLSTTQLPLKHIAEQCGYHSEFHLMRQFKSRAGMTPTEYRNRCK